MDPHIRSKIYALQMENPTERQGRHPPALVRAFRSSLQRSTHCAGVLTTTLAKIPQVDVKLDLDDPPTHEEIKVDKSPGIDGIPAEVYRRRGEAVLDKLQDLFTCWEKGTLP